MILLILFALIGMTSAEYDIAELQRSDIESGLISTELQSHAIDLTAVDQNEEFYVTVADESNSVLCEGIFNSNSKDIHCSSIKSDFKLGENILNITLYSKDKLLVKLQTTSRFYLTSNGRIEVDDFYENDDTASKLQRYTDVLISLLVDRRKELLLLTGLTYVSFLSCSANVKASHDTRAKKQEFPKAKAYLSDNDDISKSKQKKLPKTVSFFLASTVQSTASKTVSVIRKHAKSMNGAMLLLAAFMLRSNIDSISATPIQRQKNNLKRIVVDRPVEDRVNSKHANISLSPNRRQVVMSNLRALVAAAMKKTKKNNFWRTMTVLTMHAISMLNRPKTLEYHLLWLRKKLMMT
jgi:hypothetical protein